MVSRGNVRATRSGRDAGEAASVPSFGRRWFVIVTVENGGSLGWGFRISVSVLDPWRRRSRRGGRCRRHRHRHRHRYRHSTGTGTDTGSSAAAAATTTTTTTTRTGSTTIGEAAPPAKQHHRRCRHRVIDLTGMTGNGAGIDKRWSQADGGSARVYGAGERSGCRKQGWETGRELVEGLHGKLLRGGVLGREARDARGWRRQQRIFSYSRLPA